MTIIAVIGSNSFSGSNFIDAVLKKTDYKIIGISRSSEKNRIFLPHKKNENGRFVFHQLDINKDLEKIINLLKKENVDIVLVPSSSITVSERSTNLWTDTLKTMSMLFNLFIVASGTVGINGIDGSKAFGNAIIISPKKVLLAQGSVKKEEILYATLDKEDIENLKNPASRKWQPEKVPSYEIVEL